MQLLVLHHTTSSPCIDAKKEEIYKALVRATFFFVPCPRPRISTSSPFQPSLSLFIRATNQPIPTTSQLYICRPNQKDQTQHNLHSLLTLQVITKNAHQIYPRDSYTGRRQLGLCCPCTRPSRQARLGHRQAEGARRGCHKHLILRRLHGCPCRS